MEFEEHPVSELCVEYRFGGTIDAQTNQRVLQVYNYLNSRFDKTGYKVLDILPTYTTLAVHYTPESPLLHDTSALRGAIASGMRHPVSTGATKHIIDVRYDGEDIGYVCEEAGIDARTLIDLHAGREYTVAMLGFRPYFPYLLGLDERLRLPRREEPRKEVKKGSVAIAASQTGIYSENSPGGWHIIGHTDFDAFETLKPSDIIEFRSCPC